MLNSEWGLGVEDGALLVLWGFPGPCYLLAGDGATSILSLVLFYHSLSSHLYQTS